MRQDGARIVGSTRGLDSRQADRAGHGDTRGGPDPALTTHLTSSLTEILPALEQFLRFEGADQATRRSAWLPALD